jgi:hypothetical protein
MSWKRNTFLVVLVLGAFLLRLTVVVALHGVAKEKTGLVLDLHGLNKGPQGPPSNDDVEFNNLAWEVAQGHGFIEDGRPTSFRAPGFPFFLACIYAVAGQCFVLAYVCFCMLGALSCLATYFLARELLNENLSRLAAMLAAVYPPNVHLAAEFLSENVFVPLLAVGVWLFIRHLKSGSLGCLALSGLSLGAATLVRPFGLLLLPLLLLVLGWNATQARSASAGTVGTQARSASEGARSPRWRFGLVWAGLVLAVTFLAVVLPWTARNYQVHGKPVLIATNGGSTFYGGNNARVVTEWREFGHWISTTELPGRDKIEARPTRWRTTRWNGNSAGSG